MARKPFERHLNTDTTQMKVDVTWEVKELISSIAKKMGIRQSELCGIWLNMIDINSQELIDRVIHIKAKREVEKLSKTRNALLARLKRKGILDEMDNMSVEELSDFIKMVSKRR